MACLYICFAFGKHVEENIKYIHFFRHIKWREFWNNNKRGSMWRRETRVETRIYVGRHLDFMVVHLGTRQMALMCGSGNAHHYELQHDTWTSKYPSWLPLNIQVREKPGNIFFILIVLDFINAQNASVRSLWAADSATQQSIELKGQPLSICATVQYTKKRHQASFFYK